MADSTTVTATSDSIGTNSSVMNHTGHASASLITTTTMSFYNNVTDVFNTTLSSSTSESSTHHKSLKDETGTVALIVMGVIVPAIFITVVILICRQRHKDLQARRTQMLLASTQDFALEDYTTVEKATSPPPRI